MTAIYKEIEALYNDNCCSNSNEVQALDLSTFDKLIDKIANDLHNKKLKPEDLSSNLIQQTFRELNKSAEQGYGKAKYNSFPADGKGALPLELQKNLYMFSGAKCYAQLQAINNLLYDANGKLRPFNEFSQLAKQTNRQYNLNWLQAEYQTARTAAQMAQKWESFQETADIFPNLKFRTVGDDRVRNEHKALDGVIRPINDNFWKKYYPPLDWRCRCEVVQTAERTTMVPAEIPQVQLKGNVGIDGEIFTTKGSYFKLVNTNENAKRNLELTKFNAPKQLVAKNGKRTFTANIFTDNETIAEDVEMGTLLLNKLDTNILLQPVISLDDVAVGKFAIKSTDTWLYQLTNKKYKAVFEEVTQKNKEAVIINIKNGESMQTVLYNVNQIREQYSNIRYIYIVDQNKKLIQSITNQ